MYNKHGIKRFIGLTNLNEPESKELEKYILEKLKTKGIENWKELRQQTIEKYGQDFSKIDYFGYQNYVWQGPKSSMALEYKPKEGSSVVLLIVSN